MKLNWAERWVVNNPLRVIEQRLEIRLLKRMMSLKERDKILEVGCGRGAGAKLILKEFHSSSLYAMDLDLHMVQKAKAYLSRYEKGRVSLCVADVFKLPFKDRTLDAVFGFGVLHHVSDWRGGAAEIARVLKTGGVYFIEEIYPPVYQNFITKRLLLHPREDRFFSHDLRKTLKDVELPIQNAIDFKRLGILGVAVKKANSKD